MGRLKKYDIPYTGNTEQMEAAFQEYLNCVSDCFEEAYDDREERSKNAPSLRDVCDEFDISIPKARKLLITAQMYSTEQSRRVSELLAMGKSVAEITELTGLSRSSVSSYLPYKKFSYNMEETSRHAEDSRRYRERRKAVEDLHRKIMEESLTAADSNQDTPACSGDTLLWRAVIAYQNYPFYTSSGLLFSYTVKRKKDGEYSGELIVSRKEGSKTLTRSSVILAFHTVLGEIKAKNVMDADGNFATAFISPEYKGPKAIGQIFGISYIYSLFWKLGLITVPEKVEDKLKGKKNSI